MVTDAESFERLALEDPDGRWELHHGCLRQKPTDMAVEHSQIQYRLFAALVGQLDPAEFEVRRGAGRTRRATESYYIPDLMVLPAAYVARLKQQPGTLEVYEDPLPFVVEVWSKSTRRYDVDSKLPEYQRRGDLEIWRIHPYDRTVTVWQRQDGGGYSESLLRHGSVSLFAVPGVTIDIDRLFG
jgi:Uma2 family endonuclease